MQFETDPLMFELFFELFMAHFFMSACRNKNKVYNFHCLQSVLRLCALLSRKVEWHSLSMTLIVSLPSKSSKSLASHKTNIHSSVSIHDLIMLIYSGSLSEKTD